MANGTQSWADRNKSWIEVVEKLLLIITLIISISVSAYHGVGLLRAKTSEANALREEAVERKELLDALGDLYLKQLEQISVEIKAIDDELKLQPWKDTLAGENLMQIRLQKASDRQELLEKMGAQILELKRLERSEGSPSPADRADG